MQGKVTEGTLALFLMTSAAVVDRVVAAFNDQGLEPEIVATNLSQEEEDKLRAAFGA